MAMGTKVDLAVRDHVATITFPDEKGTNLINTPFMEAIIRVGEEVRQDPSTGLVILTGGGDKAFSAGADIREMAGLDAVTARAFITKLHHVCHLFRTLPVPSIARIKGHCYGGAMELAASCDLRVGSEESKYGMPEVQVGLPSVIEAAMLPTLVGWGKTRELLYTGAVVDSEEAHRIGFLQKVVPSELLDEAVTSWAEAILAADPAAIRAQKRLIEGWLDSGVAAGVQAGIEAFSSSFHTDAPNRRLRSFLEKSGSE
jgi:enoyl-CoA hydratase/carnithine racemase